MSTSSAVGPSSHHRAEAALDFVTRQINKLVEVIRQYGHVQTSSDGTHHEIAFGELFKIGQSVFPSLVGTLRAAKHQHVVTFPGETLFQGPSDNVTIRLLKEDPVGVDREAILSAHAEERPVPVDSTRPIEETCRKCSQSVYSTEKVCPNGIPLHRACFVCATCSQSLTMSNYAALDAVFYCKPHFKQAFQLGADYAKGFSIEKE